jgi:hypothetical protein
MDIKKLINDNIPENIKKQIKAYFEEQVIESPKVEAPVEPKGSEVKLKDGTTLILDKMEVGAVAMLVNEGGANTAPDADYEAEDGTVYKVVGGLVTEIVKAEPIVEETPSDNTSEMLASISTRLEAIEKKYSEQKFELDNIKKTASLSLSAVNSLLSTPAGEAIEKPNTTFAKKYNTISQIGNNKNK